VVSLGRICKDAEVREAARESGSSNLAAKELRVLKGMEYSGLGLVLAAGLRTA